MDLHEHDFPSSRGEDKTPVKPNVEDEESRSHKRRATVYDAVAGRLSNKDNRSGGNERSRDDPHHTPYSARELPYAPDEVLFRRNQAPQRFAEYDIYTSHLRDLPRGGQGVLPESDLLKAIHSYTSHLYGTLRQQGQAEDGGSVDVNERSMDETALLAFGILLEEAGRDVLGPHGDLVFTEADGEVRGGTPSLGPDEAIDMPAIAIADEESQPETRFPLRKRRKVAGADEAS